MQWVEIITMRSPGNISRELLDELLKGVDESDSATDMSKHLVEIKVYHHSVVETDFSIHIYWKSELGGQDKSPLGLRFSSALKPLGLINHSVWVETAALVFPFRDGNSERRDILESDKRDISKIYREIPEKGREENEDPPSDS